MGCIGCVLVYGDVPEALSGGVYQLLVLVGYGDVTEAVCLVVCIGFVLVVYGDVPEPLCLVVYRASEASGLVLVKLGQQLALLDLIGVGSELDRDWLRGTRRNMAVEVFDSVLRLRALVESDESHTPGYTYSTEGEGPALTTQHQETSFSCILQLLNNVYTSV